MEHVYLCKRGLTQVSNCVPNIRYSHMALKVLAHPLALVRGMRLDSIKVYSCSFVRIFIYNQRNYKVAIVLIHKLVFVCEYLLPCDVQFDFASLSSGHLLTRYW